MTNKPSRRCSIDVENNSISQEEEGAACASDGKPAKTMSNQERHFPVMLKEAIDLLEPRDGLIYVDVTAGAGGHLQELVNRVGAQSKIFAFDQDPQAIDALQESLGKRVTFIHSNFRYLKEALSKYGINTIDGGIIADLGVSSMQIDEKERGFSFQKDGPLDMRMNSKQSLTAHDIVNQWTEVDIADIIYKYGEERNSRKIAKRIVESRPINTTLELASIVAKCNYTGGRASDKQNKKIRRNKNSPGFAGGGSGQNIHPATRTFQALRMAVNAELESIEEFLEQAKQMLSPGARLVVITFHSLEDRIVKQFFKMGAQSCVCPPKLPLCQCQKEVEFLIITRKPVTASSQELLANIRSRSAKLRAGQKLN